MTTVTTIAVAVLHAASMQADTPPCADAWVRGGITYYYGQPFEGSNLGCAGYRYEEATGPWFAAPISWFRNGKVRCGDLHLIEFSDGARMLARALDSGKLDEYKVWDTGLPFVADLPHYWRNGRETATGRIVNLSRCTGGAK